MLSQKTARMGDKAKPLAAYPAALLSSVAAMEEHLAAVIIPLFQRPRGTYDGSSLTGSFAEFDGLQNSPLNSSAKARAINKSEKHQR
jgi:hypothetical protein